MLVDLTPIKEEQERRRGIAKEYNFEYLPQDDKSLKHGTGIYQCACDFNFSEKEFEETQQLSWDDRYGIFPEFDKQTYGVADNIEQIKDYYKEEIADEAKKYVICVTPVWQERQSKQGGWRWHKWGEYIGKLNPQCEYLYDEDFGEDFKYVLTFTLYAVK